MRNKSILFKVLLLRIVIYRLHLIEKNKEKRKIIQQSVCIHFRKCLQFLVFHHNQETNDDQKNKSMKSTLVQGTRVGMLDHDKLSQDTYLTHVLMGPGDSGGAIIDKDGNLIAINKAGGIYGYIERIAKENDEIFNKIKTKLGCINNVSQDYLSDDNVYQDLYRIFNEQRKFQYASLIDSSKSFATANENFRNNIIILLT